MVGMSKAKAENRPLPKRFYAAANSVQQADGFAITLDGKMVRTPKGNLLHCASQQLAQYIAAEWQAQGEHIDTDTMPLTRLLNIAHDRMDEDREALLHDIAGYLETDLICYRAPISDPALPIDSRNAQLRALQLQHFDPILTWIHGEYGVDFVVTEGLMPVPQPAASIQKIAAAFSAADAPSLAALALMVPILGSALLTLAVWKGRISAEEALAAARLDETVQAEAWGADAEVTIAWAAKCRDVKAASIFLLAHC